MGMVLSAYHYSALATLGLIRSSSIEPDVNRREVSSLAIPHSTWVISISLYWRKDYVGLGQSSLFRPHSSTQTRSGWVDSSGLVTIEVYPFTSGEVWLTFTTSASLHPKRLTLGFVVFQGLTPTSQALWALWLSIACICVAFITPLLKSSHQYTEGSCITTQLFPLWWVRVRLRYAHTEPSSP
uniref:Uncharacterized protein n=1 Tax=Candida gigantensis TaxID=271359 RepID=S5U664_9ASCO|nr:hypothetical protein [Candida gigantensis]YP_008475264.1 hypothetical protein [Candida gigantensis]AGS44576.1 hypothetical protein [Candida gigantensis]AGS44577.1 hypothetical protein [Candida gigantensis]